MNEIPIPVNRVPIRTRKHRLKNIPLTFDFTQFSFSVDEAPAAASNGLCFLPNRFHQACSSFSVNIYYYNIGKIECIIINSYTW